MEKFEGQLLSTERNFSEGLKASTVCTLFTPKLDCYSGVLRSNGEIIWHRLEI